MAGNGLHVKKIEEAKRLWKLGLSNRKIARALKVHRNTINTYVSDFANDTSSVVSLALETDKVLKHWSETFDWEKIRGEYLRGVSLNVIHEELVASGQISVLYPGFWKQVQKHISLTEATMVRVFKPGERCEIDYADGIEILDPVTGEIRSTQFFVGVLCHSRYAFAEFTWSQTSQDFLQSHVNMFGYFGGSPQLVSPDNLKSAVTKAHRYDPVINQAYSRLAEHYEIAVVPARVRTPQDKAIVERTIQIFQRYFFIKVRHRTFTSLLELNQCLKEHLIVFNAKVHRVFKRTRSEMFLEEVHHLKALPEPYKVAVYRKAILNRDCHLLLEQNYYSAPHHLRGKELDVWATAKTVEIYDEGERVAFHGRGHIKRKYVTDTNHYPPAQRAYAEEDVQTVIARAKAVGPQTSKLIEGLLQIPEPLKHFRRSQGILALSSKYSAQSLELACEQANRFGSHNVQYIERVMKLRKEVNIKADLEVGPRAYNPHLRGVSIH